MNKKYKIIAEEYDTRAEAEELLEKLALEGWSVINAKVTGLAPSGGIRVEALLEKS